MTTVCIVDKLVTEDNDPTGKISNSNLELDVGLMQLEVLAQTFYVKPTTSAYCSGSASAA